jgi:hypothetical protein
MKILFCGNFLTLAGFDIFTRWRSLTERQWSLRKVTRRREILSLMASKTFEPGTVSTLDDQSLEYGSIDV